MIEKPKRPKKIPNQDNKQPQTIQELIRRYDLDNTKIYDFLEELVGTLNKKDTYSTEEQVIGTWIDGKPLYRKVLTGNSSGIELQLDTPPEIEALVRMEIYRGNNTSHIAKIPSTEVSYSRGNTTFDVAWYKDDWIKNKIYIVSDNENGKEIAVGTVTAIIEYTKTTD